MRGSGCVRVDGHGELEEVDQPRFTGTLLYISRRDLARFVGRRDGEGDVLMLVACLSIY
ncbi:hypothetical protein M3J09_004986 [Ascochyta lentis]